MSACRPATAGAGVIRAEVIDGAKLTRFTKWGRKYLPGTAWEGTASRGFILWSCTFSDHKQEIRRILILNLRLAVELLNKEAHHRDVMGFFNLIPGRHSYKILRISNYRDLCPATTIPCRRSSQTAKRFIVLN